MFLVNLCLILNNVFRAVQTITVRISFTLDILMKSKALSQNASNASKLVNTEPYTRSTTGIIFACALNGGWRKVPYGDTTHGIRMYFSLLPASF